MDHMIDVRPCSRSWEASEDQKQYVYIFYVIIRLSDYFVPGLVRLMLPTYIRLAA